MPPGARLLRVEAEAPVLVFVEPSWPYPLVGWRHEEAYRVLREVEPVEPPEGYEGPPLLSHVAAFARKHRIPPFDGDT
jgi:hypothetical protein